MMPRSLANLVAFHQTVSSFETTDLGPEGGQSGSAPRRSAVRSGDRIGRYLILQRLGAGGMGVVFSAYDAELDRKVAVKLLRGDPADDDGTAHRRLLREAQGMAKVDHPNVITVHDVGTHQGHVFIAMEFVAGHTLREWLETSTRHWREVVDVVRQAAAGLAASHDAGLVHRDIKPDNIMVGHGGERVRVMDFGLVRAAGSVQTGPPAVDSNELLEPELVDPQSLERRAMDRIRDQMVELGKLGATGGGIERAETIDVAAPDGESNAFSETGEPSSNAIHAELTRTGALLGTPAYMAPEQIRGEPITAAADQFALAICLYQGLFGKRPFTGASIAELADQVLHAEVDLPPSPSVPRWLAAAVRRGLSKRPELRFESLEDFRAALTPPAGRNRLAWTIGGGLVLAAGAWFARGAQDDRGALCSGGALELSAAWTPSRHRGAGEAFAATGLGFARKEWEIVGPRVEAYADQWVEQYSDNCRATAILKEQSEAVMDRRRRCLVRTRAELAAVMDVLGHADAQTVERAYDMVSELPSLSRCSEARLLESDVPAPDPADAEGAELVQGHLAQADAKISAGRFDEAAQALARAVDAARYIDYPPLQTEQLIVRARLDAAEGRSADAAAALRQAHASASEHGQWQLLVDAGLELSRLYGLHLAEYDRSRLVGDIARGTVRRLNSRVDESELLYIEAMVLVEEAEYESARTKLQQSLALAIDELGPDHRVVYSRKFGLGRVAYQQGNYDEAERTQREVLLAEERSLGRQHPTTAESRDELGTVLYAKGEYASAEALHREALADLEAAVGPRHPDAARIRTHLGLSLGGQQRYAEAEAQEREALAIRRAHLAPRHPDIAQSHNNLAVNLLDQKRYDEAAHEYRAALDIVTELWGTEHPNVIVAEFGLGTTLLQAGARDQALVHLEHVWEVRKTSGSAPRRAQAAYRLATALAHDPQQRPRAHALATTAIEAYQEAGPQFDRTRLIVEAFRAKLERRMATRE